MKNLYGSTKIIPFIHENIFVTSKSYRLTTLLAICGYFVVSLLIINLYTAGGDVQYKKLVSLALLETILFFGLAHTLIRPVLKRILLDKGLSLVRILCALSYIICVGFVHFNLILSVTQKIRDFDYSISIEFEKIEPLLGSVEILLFGTIQSFLFFLIWASVYTVVALLRRQKAINEAMVEARIGQLMNQINPHFLFNTLNSIRGLMYENIDSAALSITHLSKLLRSNMLNQLKNYSTFEEELTACQAYLSLCQIRYDSRLAVRYECKGDLSARELPTLTLLTLVENAIKHGIDLCPDSGYIVVEIDCDTPDFSRLKVKNSLGKNHIEVESNKLGLLNIKQRLKLMPRSTSINILKDESCFTVEITVGKN